MEAANPEIQIVFDQERAAQLGLVVRDVADRVVNSVRGEVATRYKLRDKQIDVLVRSVDTRAASLEEIRNLIVNPGTDSPVPLSAVADVQLAVGPAEVRRVGQERVAVISANLAHGDLGSAVTALREMQSWRARQPAWLRDQDRAETDAVFASAMLIAGETETGLRSVTRALDRPDRRGLTSSSPEQAAGAHALLRRAVARAYAQSEAEQASWSGTVQGWERRLSGLGARVNAWADDERIISVLSDDARLVATFRMYVQGGIEPVPAWLLGDLVDVLGPGVVSIVLATVREQEQLEAFAPYYDAIEAEVALAQGDEARALELVASTLDALPETEALLRARVAAVGARAALERDDRAQALGFLTTAMEKDAGVIRRMGLSLPARLENRADGAAAARTAELLERSPRLDLDGDGFLITVEGTGQQLSACVYSPDATLLACAEPTLPTKAPEAGAPPDAEPEPLEVSDDDYAALLAQAFHQRAFAMPIVLSNVDLGSLDGTSTVNEQAARDKMRGLLDDLVEGQD